MTYTNYQITLDMHRVHTQVSVAVPQNDTARRLSIRLFQGGRLFMLPDGVRAVFAAQKPDGTVLYNDCIIENQSVIRYDFTEQTAAAVGTVLCQIRLYGEDGSLITGPKMTLVVYESVFSAENVVSSDEFTALNRLVKEAGSLIGEINEKLENGSFIGKSGVYVGSGDMPEEVNVQIDPLGDLCFEAGEPKILYLDENGDFSLLGAGDGFDIENGSIHAVGDKNAGARIAVLEAQVADLLYSPIGITAFSNTVGTAEKGQVIERLSLAWELNKIPQSLSVNGEAVPVTSTSLALEGQSITENTSFVLRATDERGASAEKTTTVSFRNGIYYGVSELHVEYDSAFILSLTKKLSSSKLPSFTVTAGESQYIYYCLPESMGACAFSVGGFAGGFSLADTVAFTNAWGHTENYRVYRSDNHNLGKTTVNVS